MSIRSLSDAGTEIQTRLLSSATIRLFIRIIFFGIVTLVVATLHGEGTKTDDDEDTSVSNK